MAFVTIDGPFSAQEAGQQFEIRVPYPKPLPMMPTSITLSLDMDESANVERSSISASQMTTDAFTVTWKATAPGDGHLKLTATPHGYGDWPS